MARIQVVFDAVGTLIQPDPGVAEIYFEAGRSMGSDTSFSTVKKRFRAGRKQIFSTAGLEEFKPRSFTSSEQIEKDLWRQLVEFVFDDLADSKELFELLWRRFGEVSNWALFDDVLGCLTELKTADIEVCIGSNFDARILPIAESLLPEFEMPIYFSSALGFRKPDLNFYREIAAKKPANHYVMVGDDYINDFVAPRKIGWHSIMIDRKSGCQEASADRISNLSALPLLIQMLQ